jgi:hypothetical protein
VRRCSAALLAPRRNSARARRWPLPSYEAPAPSAPAATARSRPVLEMCWRTMEPLTLGGGTENSRCASGRTPGIHERTTCRGSRTSDPDLRSRHEAGLQLFSDPLLPGSGPAALPPRNQLNLPSDEDIARELHTCTCQARHAARRSRRSALAADGRRRAPRRAGAIIEIRTECSRLQASATLSPSPKPTPVRCSSAATLRRPAAASFLLRPSARAQNRVSP